MKDYYAENAMKTMAAYCTEEGIVIVEDLAQNQIIYKIDIFGDRYKYLQYEWDITPYFSFSPDGKWLVITYGMGYIYFVELASGIIREKIRLFKEVDYSTASFEDIDTCCYYNIYTRIDFSTSGRYMAARVRGDFDPQDSDGRTLMFEPIYFRSAFVFDMETRKMIFYYSYPEEEKYKARSLGTIAFSPDDKLLVTGVFGGPVKVFELISGKESASFEMLEWVSAPRDIDNRKLVAFLNDKEFVFVNKERELVWAISDETGSWDVKTKIAAKELVAFGNNIFDIEYDRAQKSISCYGGRKDEGCVIAL